MKRQTTADQNHVPTPLVLTIKQAIQFANVGETTLLAAVACGKLKAKRLGRKILIRPADLEEWIDNLDDARTTGAR